MRLTKLRKWHAVFSLVPIFSKLRDHQIPDWRKEGLCQKGRTLVLLKGQSPCLFHLKNFLFLAWLPGSLSFSLDSPYTRCRGAWQALVRRVTKSRTQLKQLSTAQ